MPAAKVDDPNTQRNENKKTPTEKLISKIKFLILRYIPVFIVFRLS